jgi:chromate transporter
LFVTVLAAGWAYVTYQGLDWLQALFYGVGAAVIAIIAHQATKLTRRTLGRDRRWPPSSSSSPRSP